MAWSVPTRLRRAALPIRPSLESTSTGSSPPYTLGQKNRACRSAAEWNVRACTPPAPSPRSRVRISPAARVVKVTASTSVGL